MPALLWSGSWASLPGAKYELGPFSLELRLRWTSGVGLLLRSLFIFEVFFSVLLSFDMK